jgi:hypothetical protein
VNGSRLRAIGKFRKASELGGPYLRSLTARRSLPPPTIGFKVYTLTSIIFQAGAIPLVPRRLLLDLVP